MAATSRSASSSDGDSTGGYSLCNATFGTKLGISSSSLSILVGVKDTEEHSVSGVKAGHLHFSSWQSSHTSGFNVCDIFILLKATSKSKLALLVRRLR